MKKKKTLRQIFLNMQTFLDLQCLVDDLVDYFRVQTNLENLENLENFV